MVRLGALVVLVTLLAVLPAAAHDTDAPRGAPHSWLPKEGWVMNHWLPFDESRLHDLLGTDNAAVERWLRDDHRTLAGLAAKRKGMSARQLARDLVAPRRGRATAARLRLLEERTMRVLTQGHLAQHVLFHYFHGTVERSRRIFGVHPKVYQRLRGRGLTPIQVGRRGGRSKAHVKREMRLLLEAITRRGVRRGETTAPQARYMLRRRLALLRCFLHRPVPKLDPGNPYGDPYNDHRAARARPALLDRGGLEGSAGAPGPVVLLARARAVALRLRAHHPAE